MKYALLAAAFAPALSFGVTVASFDELPLAPNSFYKGADSAGGFNSNGIRFNNLYNTKL